EFGGYKKCLLCACAHYGGFVMRHIAFVLTTAVAACVATPVFAAQLPTDAQCHVIARQRGAGEGSGNRNHERFIRDCVAGKVPMEVPHVPQAVRELRAVSSDLCHEIAERRGSGETAGRRNHERFMRDCVAGKVPTDDAAALQTATQELKKRSQEECQALAPQ